MSEYFRKNQCYKGTNFADFRYSPNENRNTEPGPNSESTIQTYCYECGERIILEVPYKEKRQWDSQEKKIVNRVESNTCSKCRFKIYNRKSIKIVCECGRSNSKRISWFNRHQFYLCDCGLKYDVEHPLIYKELISIHRKLISDRGWYNLL